MATTHFSYIAELNPRDQKQNVPAIAWQIERIDVSSFLRIGDTTGGDDVGGFLLWAVCKVHCQ